MIEKLLHENEGKTLEFKENTKSLAGIIKTIIAFANTAGGTLIIGIEDKTKKVIGIENVLSEEERIINALSDSVSPLLIPSIEILSYQNKELLVVTVPHIPHPFYLKKDGPDEGVYIRSGSTNRVADGDIIQELKLLAKRKTFDELPFPQQKKDVLDWNFIQQQFSSVQKTFTESTAENLDILVHYTDKLVPSYGGILLFGKNRTKLFPDAIIRCVRFIGSTKNEVLDHTELTSYPSIALEEALHFIKKNTFTRAEFGQPRRKDIWQYPPEALRELITNAILHTDYAAIGSSIIISIFDDRIEISNPGCLPFGMTLERALTGFSKVRNRVIARVFKELKLIEQWGSGLQRVIASCKKHGLPEPLFQEFENEFKVTLFLTKKSRKKTEPFDKKLSNYIKKNKAISTKEAAKLWNINPRNARERLKNFVKMGLLKKTGSNPYDPHSAYTLA